MSTDNSTPTGDASNSGQSEQELLDAVMRSSPIMDELEVPLPTEEVLEDDPVESEEVEDPESEEVVSEDYDEEVEESEEEVAGEDDASTQPDIYTADDLDLDAMVAVKIDGQETEVSFGDLLKGYTTEQSLSKKGRELGEARKELEAERNEKLGELEAAAAASLQMLSGAENNLSKQYHDLEAQIAKARADGDTYEMNELKDKREQVQQNYWNARRRREGLLDNVGKQKQEFQAQQFNEQIQHFQEVIPSLIPDFDEKVANSIREFAIEEGIGEGLLDNVVDPKIVKFIDDYRRLKQGVSKGTAKRKAVPAKRALPTKKAPPASKKKQDAAKMRKARAFKEGSSQDDQMDFLRDYASKSLNL